MCMLGNKRAAIWYTTCMALYVKQDESRAQLSSKVAADLAQRLNKRALDHNDDAQSAMLLRNQRKTTGGGLFWTLIVIAVVLAVLIYLIFFF